MPCVTGSFVLRFSDRQSREGGVLFPGKAGAGIDVDAIGDYYLERLPDDTQYRNHADRVTIGNEDAFLAVYAGRTPVASAVEQVVQELGELNVAANVLHIQSLGGDQAIVFDYPVEAGQRKAQRGCMQRTMGRPIRGLDGEALTHRDRILLPILQRLARARLPEAESVLPDLRETVMQGRVRLGPEVRKRLWRLVKRWRDLVRHQRTPSVRPAHRPGAGSAVQAPGAPDAGIEDRNRHPGFLHLMARVMA